MAPLLLGVVAVARGDADASVARQVRDALAQLGNHRGWAHLTAALARLLDGERDVAALAENLDDIDRQALALVLAALEDERALGLLVALAQAAQG